VVTSLTLTMAMQRRLKPACGLIRGQNDVVIPIFKSPWMVCPPCCGYLPLMLAQVHQLMTEHPLPQSHGQQ